MGLGPGTNANRDSVITPCGSRGYKQIFNCVILPNVSRANPVTPFRNGSLIGNLLPFYRVIKLAVNGLARHRGVSFQHPSSSLYFENFSIKVEADHRFRASWYFWSSYFMGVFHQKVPNRKKSSLNMFSRELQTHLRACVT